VFRPTFRRPAGMAAAALVSVALFAPAGAQAQDACQNTDVAPTAANLEQVRGATLCLLNQERASHGLKSLTENPKLRLSATRHNDNMLQARYFEHTTPAGTTMVDRIRKVGYMRNASSWAVGENLAWGTGTLSTAAETQAAWMRSPGHRANILRVTYREIGIAVQVGVPVDLSVAQLGATYTTDFGTRR
jgi:uncharacterized protein YkwD